MVKKAIMWISKITSWDASSFVVLASVLGIGACSGDEGASRTSESNGATGASATSGTATGTGGASMSSTTNASSTSAGSASAGSGTTSGATGGSMGTAATTGGSSGTAGSTGGSSGTAGTTGGAQLPLWILAVEDRADNTHRLLRISVDPLDVGAIYEVCPDIAFPPSIGQDTNVTSLTFNESVLYASVMKDVVGDTLVIVDPCTCEATEVGQYGYDRVNGITSNVNEEMLGISSSADLILKIDPMTALAMFLNNLPGDWGSHGLSWSDPMDNVLYGIDAVSDRLYTFNGNDGSLIGSVPLSMDFGSVGIEYHPDMETLYTCSSPGDLWSVDLGTGTVSVEAVLGLQNCDNLAAPFGPVACVPQ